jgi:predicted nucleotidyltransferase
MIRTDTDKQSVKRIVISKLKDEPEVQRIVVFGSFLNSAEPNDIDIAIFQTTNERYLPLAMKYRRKLDVLARRIALDVIPLKVSSPRGVFTDEIARGEVICERS